MIGVNGKPALGSVAGCLLGALLTAPALAGRLQTQGPKRVILNDDGHGGFYGGQLNSAEALRNLPQRFRDTHLWIYQWGVMLGTKVNYPSQVAELCGEGASPEVLRQVRSGDRNLLALLTRLRQEKVDSLQCVAEGCHRAGLLCYVTIRANPCYPLKYPGWPDESMARFYNAKFWWDHPEFRICTKSGQVQVSLSYAYPEVRAVKLAIVREVLQRDVDGIDIDFLRHPPVLGYEEPLVKAYQTEYGVDPRKLADDDPRWLEFRCRTMTGLMREVRQLADDAGRQKHRYLGVSVRVDHRQYRQWGLDVKTWMKEGLIDILTVAQHGLGGYEFDLSPFVTMARGTGCLVFAGEEAVVAGEDPTPADEGKRKPDRPVPTRSATLTLEEYRSRARKWYSQGAAGVHTFNELRPEVFKFLGDPTKPP